MVLINLDQQHFIGLVQEAILVRDIYCIFLLFSPFPKDGKLNIFSCIVFKTSSDAVKSF